MLYLENEIVMALS